jgi:hypothetical protein
MRSTFWRIKNSYAAKARADQDARQCLLRRTRRDVPSSRHDDSLISSSILEPSEGVGDEVFPEARASNFEQLKKEIRYL